AVAAPARIVSSGESQPHPETDMKPAACLLATILLLVFSPAARAQQDDAPVPSQCLAIAQALPRATFAHLSGALPAATKAQMFGDGEVTITYAGHATYVIDTPAGVCIATDYSGAYG